MKFAKFVQAVRVSAKIGVVAAFAVLALTAHAAPKGESERLNPYRSFKFRLKCDGRYVAGLSRCSAFKRTTEETKRREGGGASNRRKSPGPSEREAITLERGITHDKDFWQWASRVGIRGTGPGAEVALKSVRKDLCVEVYNEAGQLATTYRISRCWVSEYQAQAGLDANANTVAIEHITLQHEGWESDSEESAPPAPRSVE